MASEIRVPALGESIVDATIGKWHKQVGEQVAQGDLIVELETDKVNVEVEADAAGVLGRIDAAEGANVAVGQVIGSIETNGAAVNGQAQAPAAQASVYIPAPASAPAEADAPAQAQQAVVQTADARPATATPVARRVAEANNVDIAGVAGSGPSGKVMKNDVAAQVDAGAQGSGVRGQEPTARGQGSVPEVQPTSPAPPRQEAVQPPAPSAQPPVPAAPREERRKLSRRRQTIARRLVEAQHTAAMLTTFNEVDMTAIMELRKRRNAEYEKRNGVKLGFMSFFTKAVIGALKFIPLLNAEIQGDEVVVKQHYDIGIAVGAEEGLVVPVLRDADSKSFAAIEKEIAALAKKARDNTLAISDLQGGTFTITNGGIFGSLMSTPILNAPQVGILGMHAIKERPMVVNGEIVVRPMMYLALSYDHRIVDGSEAVRFLVRVKELVEDPESLLIEG